MQFQANICNTDIVVPKVRETTALGTCFAAGLAVGFWDSLEDIKQRWVVGKKSETEEVSAPTELVRMDSSTLDYVSVGMCVNCRATRRRRTRTRS